MIWLDIALKTAALASTVIATLRAGSRVAYLTKHDGIGIMEGPTIKKSNETYPLFELSEAFRHCVRLSFAPNHYEDVKKSQPVEAVVEAYPLSQKPYLPANEQNESEMGTERMSEGESVVPVLREKTKATFWTRQFKSAMHALSLVPPSVGYTKRVAGMVPKVVSYWAGRFWNTAKKEPTKDDVEDLYGEI